MCRGGSLVRLGVVLLVVTAHLLPMLGTVQAAAAPAPSTPRQVVAPVPAAQDEGANGGTPTANLPAEETPSPTPAEPEPTPEPTIAEETPVPTEIPPTEVPPTEVPTPDDSADEPEPDESGPRASSLDLDGPSAQALVNLTVRAINCATEVNLTASQISQILAGTFNLASIGCTLPSGVQFTVRDADAPNPVIATGTTTNGVVTFPINVPALSLGESVLVTQTVPAGYSQQGAATRTVTVLPVVGANELFVNIRLTADLTILKITCRADVDVEAALLGNPLASLSALINLGCEVDDATFEIDADGVTSTGSSTNGSLVVNDIPIGTAVEVTEVDGQGLIPLDAVQSLTIGPVNTLLFVNILPIVDVYKLNCAPDVEFDLDVLEGDPLTARAALINLGCTLGTTTFDVSVNQNVVLNDGATTNGQLEVSGVASLDLGSTVTVTENVPFGSVAVDPSQTLTLGLPLTSLLFVNLLNGEPDAADDSATTPELIAKTIAVLTNDTDPNDDTLTITDVSDPLHGSATIAGSEVTYTPDPTYNGSDSFTYTIDDGRGGTATATVNLTVTPVNDAPVANDDSSTTNEDTPVSIPVLTNDTDVDNDTLSVSAVTQPAHGVVTIAGSNVSYAPATNFSGNDSFTYTASDGHGGTDTATVTLTVNQVNDVPAVADDAYTVNEDGSLIVTAPGVLGNDSDVDGHTLTATALDQPDHGTLSLQTTGAFTYTPAANFNGTDTFTYTAADGHGGSAVATVTITVTPVNDAPVANPDTDSTTEGTGIDVDVIANDTDVDGDTPTVIAVSDPPHGTTSINLDGTIAYTPDPDFSGTDSFTYTLSDGHGGTTTGNVVITVTPVNDDPTAGDDSYSTAEGVTLSVAAPGVLANDTDPDGDTPTATVFDEPDHGDLTLNPNGSFTYIPDANYDGPDSFTYTAADGNGGTDTATVSLTVIAVDDVPVAVDDLYTTAEDTNLTIAAPGVLGNDADPDNPLSVADSTQPTDGTVVVNPNGSFTYDPDDDFHGTDSFTYTIGSGAETDTATVTITVTAVNDAPTANDDSVTTGEDTAIEIDVLANDTDPDLDTLTIISVSQPAHGSVVVNANGTITYTPAPDSTAPDQFSYTISDGHGGTGSASGLVTITPGNDQPIARDDTYGVGEDGSLVIAASGVLGNDEDPDGDDLTAVLVDAPEHGTLDLDDDGSFTYTPDADYNGSDSFTYRPNDGALSGNLATVTITIGAANDLPTAGDDDATTEEETPVTIDVLANDEDVDGDTLTVTGIAAQPEHGTATIENDGKITYTPDEDYTGPDQLVYTISDGQGTPVNGTVTITVTPVNDGPTANDDTATTSEATTVTIDLLANDTDPDGDTLTVTNLTTPANGTVEDNGDGTVDYTPDDDFLGQDDFSYTISDGNGGTATGDVTVEVDEDNTPPHAVGDIYSVTEGGTLTVPSPGVLANDSDPDDDDLSVTILNNPANGTVTLELDGSFVYSPDDGFFGLDGFDYTLADGKGGTDIATVTVTVEEVATDPVAADDVYATIEDTALAIDTPGVLNNDANPGNDLLTLTIVTDPENGELTLDQDGSFAYTPDPEFDGTDTFTYAIENRSGDGDEAEVDIQVIGLNDPPDAVDDEAATGEDESTTIDVLANDDDPDGDDLTVTAVTQGDHGNVTINDDGTVTYAPSPDYTGSDAFTYTISDGATTDTANVTVTVTTGNDAPDAVDDEDEANRNESVTIPVLANDTDPEGDELAVASVSAPSFGEVTIDPSGTVTYTPGAGFNTDDSFTYTASDGHGGTDTATVTIINGGGGGSGDDDDNDGGGGDDSDNDDGDDGGGGDDSDNDDGDDDDDDPTPTPDPNDDGHDDDSSQYEDPVDLPDTGVGLTGQGDDRRLPLLALCGLICAVLALVLRRGTTNPTTTDPDPRSPSTNATTSIRRGGPPCPPWSECRDVAFDTGRTRRSAPTIRLPSRSPP